MPKGQQRGNREAKKPKKKAAPAPQVSPIKGISATPPSQKKNG